MTKTYSSLAQVFSDSQLYATLKQGGSYTMDLFNSIAQNKWQWVVDNWTSLHERFLGNAFGNENQLTALDRLEKEVTAYRIGNPNNPLEDPVKFAEFIPFLEQIDLSEVELSPQEIKNRNDELLRVSNLTEDDFRNMLEFLRKMSAITAQDIGLGDETSEEFLGLNPRVKRRSATIKDLDKLTQLNQLYKYIEGFIFDLQVSQKRPPNLLAIANQNQEQGSAAQVLDIYKTSAPIPFEISLEHMAKKYLGDSRRWFELVTVNNLQPPFVDESGEKFDLLAPGAGSTIIVSSANKDFIAPSVKISIGSNRYREETRTIESVTINENDTMVLFLSGDRDLSKFKPTEGGFIRVYKPATTRRNEFILVPLTIPSSSVASSKPTPKADYLRRLHKAFINFGIDVKRDDATRDLILSPSGDFQLAAGIPAVRQSVINALRTRIGELTYHPQYGVNHNIGSEFFGSTDESVVFAEIVRTAILSDPRFESVLINRLAATEGGFSMQLLVKIKGFDQPIPLAFIS